MEEESPLVLEVELATAHLRAAGWPDSRIRLRYEVTVDMMSVRIAAGGELLEDVTVFEVQLLEDGAVEARWHPIPTPAQSVAGSK